MGDVKHMQYRRRKPKQTHDTAIGRKADDDPFLEGASSYRIMTRE